MWFGPEIKCRGVFVEPRVWIITSARDKSREGVGKQSQRDSTMSHR